ERTRTLRPVETGKSIVEQDKCRRAVRDLRKFVERGFAVGCELRPCEYRLDAGTIGRRGIQQRFFIAASRDGSAVRSFGSGYHLQQHGFTRAVRPEYAEYSARFRP